MGSSNNLVTAKTGISAITPFVFHPLLFLWRGIHDPRI